MIDAKPKRKHAPNPHRLLHRFLLVWMVVTFLAAFYPLIWLVPPYIQLTPFIYVLASLGWMPFAFRHIRRHGWRWLTVGLMVGCLGMTSYSTKMIEHRTQASNCETVQDSLFVKYECREPGSCYVNIAYISVEHFPLSVLGYEQFAGTQMGCNF